EVEELELDEEELVEVLELVEVELEVEVLELDEEELVEVVVEVVVVLDVVELVVVEEDVDVVVVVVVVLVEVEVVVLVVVEVVVGGTQSNEILRHTPRIAVAVSPVNWSSIVTGRGRKSGCPSASRMR